MNKKDLLELEAGELREELISLGEKPFRATQIWKWLYAGELDFRQMGNLPLSLRNMLSERYSTGGIRIREKLTSKVDGTRKYLFELDDGNIIEGVLMKYNYGYSACLSTQGKDVGWVAVFVLHRRWVLRNLTIGECGADMCMTRDIKNRISHVVQIRYW